LVSVSFRVRVVRASGRGEAAWACEVMWFSTLEARPPTFTPSGRFRLGVVCDDSLQGFKTNVAFCDDSLQGFKKHIALLDDSLQGFKEIA